MNSHAQNKEDLAIIEYLRRTAPNDPWSFLDIGANDGLTFSNTRMLYRQPQFTDGVCVEPSPAAFGKLLALYKSVSSVQCINAAIGTPEMNGTTMTLNEGSDTLVSSLDASRNRLWERGGTTFSPVEVPVVDVPALLAMCHTQTFTLISIDAEGYDWPILQQMDLDALGCRVLIVEYGQNLKEIRGHAKRYGMTELLVNGENVLFGK